MEMIHSRLCIALMTVVVSVCCIAVGHAEEVKVGAGAAPVENIFSKIKDPMEKATGVKLTIIANGPVQAIMDLDKGLVDVAASGVSFADWMLMMEKKGYPIADRSIYRSRVIGKDLVKVLTNKDAGVRTLSKQQLKDIFTGRATNWKEVGGSDKPVVVLLGSKIPGIQNVFQKQIMDGEAYSPNAQKGTDAPDLRSKVVSLSGAVCLGPMSSEAAAADFPGIPEIGRPLVIATKGEPSGAVLKMLDFIRGEGQKYIVK